MKNYFRKMKNEDGAVMVLVAILMVVLLAMTSLAMDMGLAYFQKQRLQNACDAAALAGSQSLPNASTAERYAREYFSQNYNQPCDVNVVITDSNSKIRVTAKTDIATVFGKILGTQSIDITANAAAGKKVKRTVSNTNFKYLLYADEGNLPLGGQWRFYGSVHSNGTVQVSAQDGTGFVEEVSYGTKATFQAELAFPVKNESTGEYINYYLYELKSGKLYIKPATSTDNKNNLYCVASKDQNGKSLADLDAANISYAPLSHFLEEKGDVEIPKELYADCETKISEMKSSFNSKMNDIKNAINDKPNTWKYLNWKGDGNRWNTMQTFYNTSHPLTNRTICIDEDNTYATGGSDVTLDYEFVLNRNGANAGLDYQGGKALTYKQGMVFYCNNPDRSSFTQSYTNCSSLVINSHLYANTSVKIMASKKSYWPVEYNKYVIDGDVYVDGNLYLQGVKVTGDIYATGNIELDGCVTEGFVAAKKDIKFTNMQTSSSSLAKDINANPLSVYSQNGDILCAPGDSNSFSLAGIMVAPNGDITLQNNIIFYGHIIGKTIGKGSQMTRYMEGHPLTDLPNYEANKDQLMDLNGGSQTIEEDVSYVLVE